MKIQRIHAKRYKKIERRRADDMAVFSASTLLKRLILGELCRILGTQERKGSKTLA